MIYENCKINDVPNTALDLMLFSLFTCVEPFIFWQNDEQALDLTIIEIQYKTHKINIIANGASMYNAVFTI